MKKLLTLTLVLGSTMAVSACTSSQESTYGLDGSLTQAPYTEERTVGATQGSAAPVRSAEPVFENKQMK